VLDVEGSALDFTCSVLDEPDGLIKSAAVAEVDVGPNTFDIAVVDCFKDVWVA
jgi:hypothetical protein